MCPQPETVIDPLIRAVLVMTRVAFVSKCTQVPGEWLNYFSSRGTDTAGACQMGMHVSLSDLWTLLVGILSFVRVFPLKRS